MKRVFVLILALMMILMLTACGKEPDTSGSLTFSTGSETGTYFAFGTVMGAKVSDTTDTQVTVVSSNGSQSNIEALKAGEADIAFVQSDVMAYGYNGTRLFTETGAVTNFSAVAAMYLEQVQIVTLDPSIKSVADLAGKRVSIGATGSGVYYNAMDILGVYGLTEADIAPAFYDFSKTIEALREGEIDAGFVVAGAPTNAVTSLTQTNDAYLVSLDDEHISALVASSPYYAKNTIGFEVYDTLEDVITVGISAVVIVRDSASEEDVYNFISAVFNNLGTLEHDKTKEVSLDFAASVTDVPYHPGAARYFRERGLTVPTK
ncbi:MAG: TAXI family TRAP transporter solute-binding subunit [Christensenellaceae bacterium]|nr:TAXI family TRAP transporter solute-binding subunit [Christensenellaceae bacterium]